MKRDMDAIRAILFAMEAHPSTVPPGELVVSGYDHDTIVAHVQMLHEAQFITAIDASTRNNPDWLAVSIQPKGHDFLAAARDDTTWNDVKTHLGGTLDTISLLALQRRLVTAARGQAGRT